MYECDMLTEKENALTVILEMIQNLDYPISIWDKEQFNKTIYKRMALRELFDAISYYDEDPILIIQKQYELFSEYACIAGDQNSEGCNMYMIMKDVTMEVYEEILG